MPTDPILQKSEGRYDRNVQNYHLAYIHQVELNSGGRMKSYIDSNSRLNTHCIASGRIHLE